jgi:NAD+ synthase
MSDLSINTELARTILTGFIRSEITRAGFSRAVINLSGGLDSTLACYLAAEALGGENVLALRLPYQTSSDDSLNHAQMVIDALGVPSITIPISEMVDPLIERFPEAGPVRRGNIMARMRMIVLYDQSEAFRALPVGTGNKTEILLGYTTLYGDSACAINPLGGYIRPRSTSLPGPLGARSDHRQAPTADLWVGQTDEASWVYL